MRLSYSSRFWLYAPLALFLGLTAWAIIHWWLAASALDSQLKLMNGRQAVPGIRLSWKTQTLSGFPFRVDVVLDDFSVRAEGPRGPLIWHSEHFASHALTYGRTQDIFEAAGQQTLVWTDADGARHQLTFLPASLRASSIANDKGLLRFDLDMLDAGGTDSDGQRFTVSRAQLHMRHDPKQDGLDLVLSAVEAKDPATPFGARIKSLTLYARVTQGSAFARLLAGQTGWMDALMAWRHQGGAIVPGPVDIQSSALTTKAVTPELQPRLRALLFPFYY
jgi:hypothetical protein